MSPASRALTTVALIAAVTASGTPSIARAESKGVELSREQSATVPGKLLLKRLPADRNGLTFRGESDNHSYAVFMTRQEADKVGEFQLSLTNAVSAQPDRSSLRFSVNGRVLATVPVRSPSRANVVSIHVPAGVLVPGFNAVSIASTLFHRVDCSVKATYELWTSVDPADTGFVLPPASIFSGRAVSDIGGEPPGPDGTTRLHVRLPDHPDAEAVERATRVVERLVAEAHITRPLVDVGPEAGTGPGLDIAFSGIGHPDSDVALGRVLLRRSDLSLLRDPASGRLTVLSEEADPDPAQKGAEATGDASALSVVARGEGQRITEAGRISFDDLGLPDDSFSGRHYLRSLHLQLPSDFYPGSYDKVRLLLDGGYTGDLDGQSSLVFRVNDALVSTLLLRSGTPGHFQHETVELPLQFFRPGFNDVSIEGVLSTTADAACDPTTKPESARLVINGSSEIEIPHLAHLGTMPQIAGALPAGDPPGQDVHDLYLLHDDPAAIGSALTVSANLAATSSDVPSLRIHFTAPGVGDHPGLVLGTRNELPTSLARAIDRLTTLRQPVSGLDGGPASLHRSSAPTFVQRADRWFRQRGFFFTPAPDERRRLVTDDHTLLMASVRPNEAEIAFGGIEIPRFADDGRQWLVITAGSADTISAGIDRLVAGGLWSRLNGEAIAINIDDGRFSTIDADTHTYVLPRSVRMADLRPIMGGLMSSNILLTASAAILLLALLGLTTHGLLRSDRRRPK
ncbi:MAG: cellulose biosynthesis cyclic di-GMP-binding regulatory protein BcsB [Janthinobacterium lividum]